MNLVSTCHHKPIIVQKEVPTASDGWMPSHYTCSKCLCPCGVKEDGNMLLKQFIDWLKSIK